MSKYIKIKFDLNLLNSLAQSIPCVPVHSTGNRVNYGVQVVIYTGIECKIGEDLFKPARGWTPYSELGFGELTESDVCVKLNDVANYSQDLGIIYQNYTPHDRLYIKYDLDMSGLNIFDAIGYDLSLISVSSVGGIYLLGSSSAYTVENCNGNGCCCNCCSCN